MLITRFDALCGHITQAKGEVLKQGAAPATGEDAAAKAKQTKTIESVLTHLERAEQAAMKLQRRTRSEVPAQ